ncbi:MAG: DegT/DnrJ/EryC1/StrS family aminotransferase, partial [Patescibacteria group bacterium]
RYKSQFISGHSRIPEIQAAILNIAIRDISRNARKRKEVFRWYREALKETNLGKHVRLFLPTPETDPMMHLLVAEVDDRDGLRVFLAKKNIPTQVHYPYPVHSVSAFMHLGYRKGSFPMAERVARRIVSLPYHEYLTKKDVQYIIDTMKFFYAS